MRVLINVNEQISASMMEKHFQASSLEAEVTAAPNNMMLEMLKAFNFDLLAYYAEEVDNAALLSLFVSTGNIRKILFVKKQNLALVSADLEDMLDECFTIPLDSNDVMIRLRRMFRASEQKTVEVPLQQQQPAPVTQEQPQPLQYQPPVVQAPPQAMQYQPPVEQAPPQAMPYQPPVEQAPPQAIPYQPPVEQAPPQAMPYQPPVAQAPPQAMQYQPPVEKEPTIAPIQTAYTYTPENFRQQTGAQTGFISEPQRIYEPEMRAGYPAPSTSPDTFPRQAQNPVVQSKKSDKKSLVVRIASGLSKALFYLLVFIVAILAVFMVKSKVTKGTPSIFGYELYGVLSGSMNGSEKTSFDTGSLVFVKAKDVQKIEVGDIITFRGLSVDAPLTTHRVVGINQEGSLSFITKGDANDVKDPSPISAEKVVGTVRGHVPFIGYLTGFAETKTGLIFLVFVPGAIIITYELFNIYRTLKNDRKKRKDD